MSILEEEPTKFWEYSDITQFKMTYNSKLRALIIKVVGADHTKDLYIGRLPCMEVGDDKAMQQRLEDYAKAYLVGKKDGIRETREPILHALGLQHLGR